MKFLIQTNGCEPTKGNIDTLRQSLVNEIGLFEATADEKPDIVIFFPCTFNQTIRDDSDTIMELIVKEQSQAELILVTGCFLDKQFESIKNIKYSKYQELVKTIKTFLVNREYEKNNTPYSRKVPFVEISRGCYGACSFCSIVSVKGRHVSYNEEIIIKNISELISDGYHTIKLVGDEVAGYGMDCGSSLENLLSTIHKNFPNLKVELGQLNPNILKDWKPEDYYFLSNPMITGSIFLPLQSASHDILKKMNRYYSPEEYSNIYQQIRKVRTNGEISTDIIIGFPTETEEDHQQNLSFLMKHQFDFLGVFIFDKSDKKTKAGRMDRHVAKEVKQRRYDEIIDLISLSKPTNV